MYKNTAKSRKRNALKVRKGCKRVESGKQENANIYEVAKRKKREKERRVVVEIRYLSAGKAKKGNHSPSGTGMHLLESSAERDWGFLSRLQT
jgi:hypothetical protein